MLKDQYNRSIEYIRISITDRCNLRCQYCMPEEGVPFIAHDDILRFDEILRFVCIMASLGVKRVRLTGGEPLVRKDVVSLAHDIKKIDGIDFLGITTNGVLLNEMAEPLYRAGVDAVNISLDTMDKESFLTITKRDYYDGVMAGIEKTLSIPFAQVKINTVLIPDGPWNDWFQIAQLAQDNPIDVRFIEWMPISQEEHGTLIQRDQLLCALEKRFGKPTLLVRQKDSNAGPAVYWQFPNFMGRIGIIHAMSNHFCDQCNRVRLSATGDMKLCLFYDMGVSLRELLRSDVSDEEIVSVIQEALAHKPKEHQNQTLTTDSSTDSDFQIKKNAGMHSIGG